MSRYLKPNNKKNNYFRWAYIVFFCLISLWLLTSIILQKNPTEVLSSAVSKIPNPTNEAKDKTILEKDSIIEALKAELSKCKGSNFSKALVIIDGSTLNMRSEAALTSKIVMRIPANSEVEIMFYDTETYYLNGEAGRWCRIRYAEKEGWVWGNFISEI